MNFFCFWKNEKGEDKLITSPLDGTVLPRITRKFFITLFEELKEFTMNKVINTLYH